MSESQEIEYISQIEMHKSIIYKVIELYVDDAEDKKDMYQEVLLQGWKSYRNFRRDSKFSTWLYKVALNTALTFRKKQKRIITANVIASHTDHQADENHELLFKVIKKLDDIEKMIITLHLDGYKNKEIAEITGMTSNNINVKLYRLKAHIIERFKLLYHA